MNEVEQAWPLNLLRDFPHKNYTNFPLPFSSFNTDNQTGRKGTLCASVCTSDLRHSRNVKNCKEDSLLILDDNTP